MKRQPLRYEKEGDWVTRQIAGETIIVPVSDHVGDLNAIYTMNGVGTSIWEHIDGRSTVSQIVEAVRQEYDVEPKEALHDVCHFLASLEAAGLIREGDES